MRQSAEAGLLTLVDTGEAVLAGDREESVAGLRERIGADRLRDAVAACRAVAANNARGVVDAVIARYPDLRKSLPAFWSLPFVSETGRDDLLAALEVVRSLDKGVIKALPEDAPTNFVPAVGTAADNVFGEGGRTHVATVTGGKRPERDRGAPFFNVNTLISNLSTALKATYKVFSPKHLPDYLGAFCWTTNHRRNMRGMIGALCSAAASSSRLTRRSVYA